MLLFFKSGLTLKWMFIVAISFLILEHCNWLLSDVPSFPANLRVTDVGDGGISIAWDVPKSDGGSPVTGYVVETCRTGTTGWTKAGSVDHSTLAFDISGLITGDYYFIRCYAENLAGLCKRPAELGEPVCAKQPTSMIGYWAIALLIRCSCRFIKNFADIIAQIRLKWSKIQFRIELNQIWIRIESIQVQTRLALNVSTSIQLHLNLSKYK